MVVITVAAVLLRVPGLDEMVLIWSVKHMQMKSCAMPIMHIIIYVLSRDINLSLVRKVTLVTLTVFSWPHSYSHVSFTPPRAVDGPTVATEAINAKWLTTHLLLTLSHTVLLQVSDVDIVTSIQTICILLKWIIVFVCVWFCVRVCVFWSYDVVKKYVVLLELKYLTDVLISSTLLSVRLFA